MYELFIGNYENVMGRTVYHKNGNDFIPCIVTNFYFKSRKYTLVPVKDVQNISVEECDKRRVYFTRKIYVEVK